MVWLKIVYRYLFTFLIVFVIEIIDYILHSCQSKKTDCIKYNNEKICQF